MASLHDHLADITRREGLLHDERMAAIANEPRTFHLLTESVAAARLTPSDRYVGIYADGSTRTSNWGRVGHVQRPAALRTAERPSLVEGGALNPGCFIFDRRTGEVLNGKGEVVHQGEALDG